MADQYHLVREKSFAQNVTELPKKIERAQEPKRNYAQIPKPEYAEEVKNNDLYGEEVNDLYDGGMRKFLKRHSKKRTIKHKTFRKSRRGRKIRRGRKSRRGRK